KRARRARLFEVVLVRNLMTSLGPRAKRRRLGQRPAGWGRAVLVAIVCGRRTQRRRLRQCPARRCCGVLVAIARGRRAQRRRLGRRTAEGWLAVAGRRRIAAILQRTAFRGQRSLAER